MNRLLLLFLLLAPVRLLAGEDAWKPASTWVFAVGVLNYDDPGLTTYPDEGRVDAILLDTFRKRGVPDDRIVLQTFDFFVRREEFGMAKTRSSVRERL
jgi:hypothetical protein